LKKRGGRWTSGKGEDSRRGGIAGKQAAGAILEHGDDAEESGTRDETVSGVSHRPLFPRPLPPTRDE